jgi:hypothetical protein
MTDFTTSLGDHPHPLTRRGLLQTAVYAAIPVLAAGHRVARADCHVAETMTVWRLASDWGYPRGPNGKTRLVSRASRNAASHRYALSERDALDMNLHLCSCAPASALVVRQDEFMTLWDELAYRWSNPWLGRSVWVLDDRHVSRLAGGTGRLARALSPESASDGTCPDDGAAPEAVAPAVLPFTGLAGLGAPALGAGLLLAGMIGLRSARGVGPTVTGPRVPRRRPRGRHVRR